MSVTVGAGYINKSTKVAKDNFGESTLEAEVKCETCCYDCCVDFAHWNCR